MVKAAFYFAARTEQFEVFSYEALETFLQQQVKLTRRQALESADTLAEDPKQPAAPALAVSQDDLVIYQRQLPVLWRYKLVRVRFQCFFYVDQLDDQFFDNIYQVYRLQQQLPEVTFTGCARGVITPEHFEELRARFTLARSLNLFAYRPGLHNALQ